MAQFDETTGSNTTELRAARTESVTAPPTRASVAPIVGVACAIAVAACAWFAYEQGKQAALTPTPISTQETTGDASLAAASNNSVSGDATSSDGSNTTVVQTAAYGQPDIIMTVHPGAQNATASNVEMRPKRTMLAKASRVAPKPANAEVPQQVTALERQVALTSRPQPSYPSQALRAREQGTVMVLAQVDTDGKVSDARVVRHSGSIALDRAAPNEVKRWTFQPALHDGRPVMASVEVPVSYRLEP